MPTRYSHPLPFGAAVQPDGRTRFRLWAPSCDAVTLEVEGAAPQVMTRDADGWHSAEAACGAGARYRYRLPDGLAVPDPASRRQPEGVHGASEVVDPAAFQWQADDWQGRPWEETVLYELHVGAFGGYRGVLAELPRLKALGVTAVELMPLSEFPGDRNWGYDGVLPFAAESAYGTPEELKTLIDNAHALGLMVFLDVVYNHFGPDGNYLGSYAAPFFRHDVDTPWGAAIDFRQPAVREYFTQNALFWLMEYRFDGLRLDAVHAIVDDGWLKEMAAAVSAAVEPGRQVHLVLENDDNAAELLRAGYRAQWNDDGHHVLHTLLTDDREGYYGDYADGAADRLVRCLTEGFVYQGEPSPFRGGARRGEASADLPPTAFVLFLQNHDQTGNRAFGDRLATLCPAGPLRAATALHLLCPQVPLLFMGEEGASRRPFLYFTSHDEELAVLVREGRRREFAGFPQFADPVSREKIPDPNAVETFERSRLDPAEADSPEGARHLVLVRQLLQIRASCLAPRLAGATALEGRALGAKAVFVAWRLGDGSSVQLWCNLADQPVELTQAGPASSGGELLFEQEAGAFAALQDGRLPAATTIALCERG